VNNNNYLKKVYHCLWCKEGSGLIYPEDLPKAIRMPDGSLKCYTCQTEELRDRIVRVTPNSQRAREIIAEDKHEVDKHNQGAERLNRSAGVQLMKRRSYKY
jgi:hypothetical protein